MRLNPRLVFGCNVFGWTVDELTTYRLLDAIVDAGIPMLDTADAYSTWVPGNQGGESETLIGKWLKRSGKRSKILIATKVGMEMGPAKQGLSKKRVIQAVEESLQRLQTDTIDLYQTHKDDLSTPVAETLETYTQLIKEGKVRAIGASQMTPARLEESLRCSDQNNLARYTTLQPLYNLYDREGYERDYAPICAREGLQVIPYYGLAAGFLTGKYRVPGDLSKSQRGERRIKDSYLNPRGLQILQAMDQVAERIREPHAAIALAWLMSRPTITAPIASATSLPQLHQLLRATQIQLDPQTVEILDRS